MTKKRERLIIISVALSLFLLLLFVSYIINPQPVNAMMVGSSSLEERAEKVYLEPTISENVQNLLLDDYEQAKERITGLFDGAFATPVILFVQSSEALDKYTQNNRTGQTLYILGKLHCYRSRWI